MISPSLGFFLKAVLYFMIVFLWLDIINEHTEENVQKFKISPVKNPENQTCLNKCLAAYKIITKHQQKANWLYCNQQNVSNQKHQTKMQYLSKMRNISIDCINRQKVINQNEQSYSVVINDLSCLIKRDNFFYQCVILKKNKDNKEQSYRITNSFMSESFSSDMIYRLRDLILSFFEDQTKNSIISLFQKTSQNQKIGIVFYSLLGVIVLAFFLTGDSLSFLYLSSYTNFFEKIGVKQKGQNQLGSQTTGSQYQEIQYGFKLIESIQQQFLKNIKGQFNRKELQTTQTFNNIFKFLDQVEHRKIKFLKGGITGIGLESNIQSWVQKKVHKSQNDAIYLDLKHNIPNRISQKFKVDKFQNFRQLIFAILHEKQRGLKNIVNTHLNGIFLTIQNSFYELFQLKFQSIFVFFITSALINFSLYCSFLALLFYVKQIVQAFYFIYEKAKSLFSQLNKQVSYCITQLWSLCQKFRSYFKAKQNKQEDLKKQNGLKKQQKSQKILLVVDHLQIIWRLVPPTKKQQFVEVIKNCLQIQYQRKYDIILISHCRRANYEIKQIMEQHGESPFKQYDFQPSLPFKQMKDIIKKRSSVQSMGLLGLITNSIKKITQILRALGIDKKYNPNLNSDKDKKQNTLNNELQKYFKQQMKVLKEVINFQIFKDQHGYKKQITKPDLLKTDSQLQNQLKGIEQKLKQNKKTSKYKKIQGQINRLQQQQLQQCKLKDRKNEIETIRLKSIKALIIRYLFDQLIKEKQNIQNKAFKKEIQDNQFFPQNLTKDKLFKNFLLNLHTSFEDNLFKDKLEKQLLDKHNIPKEYGWQALRILQIQNILSAGKFSTFSTAVAIFMIFENCNGLIIKIEDKVQSDNQKKDESQLKFDRKLVFGSILLLGVLFGIYYMNFLAHEKNQTIMENIQHIFKKL